jgi:hypothetical protein
MRHLVYLSLPLLLAPLVMQTPVQALESEDLYRLCSQFPHNAQCKGYEAPVPLEKRPGKMAACVVKLPESETKGACKVQVEDAEITL